jgi:uncharacterized protein YbcI
MARAASASGEMLAEISNIVVATYADHLGRGPTKARSYLNEGVVTCVLEDTLTRTERKLIAAGNEAAVLELRQSLQEMMRGPLRAALEAQTGCTVKAVIAGTELEPDISSQVFVLDERIAEPDAEGARRLVNSAGSPGRPAAASPHQVTHSSVARS